MLKITLIIALLFVLLFNSFAQKSWIRINQVGYTPQSVKVAVLASKEDIAIKSFEIVDILTEETVFHGHNIQIYDTTLTSL
jgi:hypothetical protein